MIAAICDDNPLHLKKAESLTRDYLDAHQVTCRIHRFSGPQALLAALKGEEMQPDLAVLDIEMPGENGISLAKKINRLVPGCRIIFLTAYIDYAPKVYEADHIWFVVKNRAEEFFPSAMDKALSSLADRDTASPGLLVREEGKTVFLPLESVIYLSKVNRKALPEPGKKGRHQESRQAVFHVGCEEPQKGRRQGTVLCPLSLFHALYRA